jgi:hypothetical protein
MEPNALFIRVFDELEIKSKSNDWYDILSCARLLRQLLVDKEPLAVSANRRLGIKVEYDVVQFKMSDALPKPKLHIRGDGLDS